MSITFTALFGVAEAIPVISTNAKEDVEGDDRELEEGASGGGGGRACGAPAPAASRRACRRSAALVLCEASSSYRRSLSGLSKTSCQPECTSCQKPLSATLILTPAAFFAAISSKRNTSFGVSFFTRFSRCGSGCARLLASSLRPRTASSASCCR